jgi:hypothetical protein
MPILPAPVRRSLSHTLAAWRDGQARSSMLAARLARAARLRAVAAGALSPEVAVLECGSGRHASGLFSEVASVLGLLDHYERKRRLYAGVKVRFSGGLYLDPPFGDNWWEYYFAPVDIATGSDAPSRVVSQHYHDLCANRVERAMSRSRGAALLDRYVAVQPPVRNLVDRYVAGHWDDAHIVGVHYRGTDKAIDAPRVSYPDVESIVRDRMTASPRCRIYLATDEQPFLDFMRARFPEQLLFRTMFRSADGRPTDVVNADGNYQKGLDAVVDCLLLSRTHFLVRTASNLSLCATLFNPRLPNLLLNPER